MYNFIFVESHADREMQVVLSILDTDMMIDTEHRHSDVLSLSIAAHFC